MATADLYLRLSLDFEGATSIDRQEVDCRRWCAAHDLIVREVHVDRGVSGYSAGAHRSGFDAALAAVSCGEVATLVVWKLDRLSRRGVGQVGALLDDFERAGARLVSVQDQLDTAQPQARMIIALLSEFARAESETMGMRIKSAKEAQRASGQWLSGKPPFGYAIAPDRRLVPVEPAAGVMREVFGLINAGLSLGEICRRLNARGLRNSRGTRWTTPVLSDAIRTPAYAGLTPVRHVTAEGRHASGKPAVYRDRDTGMEVSCLAQGARPIVSRSQQLAAFAALELRMRRYGRGMRPVPVNRSHALLVRGLGRCAGCDRSLVTHGGYKCRRYNSAGESVCARPVNATIGVVDRHVTEAWHALLGRHTSDSEALRRAVAQRWTPTPRRLTGRARLQAERVDLGVRLEDADAAHYVRGDLDSVRHAKVVNALQRRIARVEAALADSEPAVDVTPLDDPAHVAARWEQETPDGRRALVGLAWHAVTVAKAARRGDRWDPERVTYNPRT